MTGNRISGSEYPLWGCTGRLFGANNGFDWPGRRGAGARQGHSFRLFATVAPPLECGKEVSLIFVAFFALIVLPALDHRYGWSPVPSSVTIAGDVLIVLSFLFIFRVIKVNSYAASNIRVEKGQTVIDTGPYAYVRHPMYAGAIWLFIAIPLALGAWWWTLLTIPCSPVLVWRLLDEEKILRRDLRGYREYTERVRYRLIPYLW
jgi:protein-S-isoprenylcysteine O-methyltransferase Ste14